MLFSEVQKRNTTYISSKLKSVTCSIFKKKKCYHTNDKTQMIANATNAHNGQHNWHASLHFCNSYKDRGCCESDWELCNKVRFALNYWLSKNTI